MKKKIDDTWNSIRPKAYSHPARVTPRGTLVFFIAILVAYVVLTILDKQIPPGMRELVALVIGYGGARTLKQ